MKRYWLFCYEGYEAVGGMQDFVKDFNFQGTAIAWFNEVKVKFSMWEYAHILDRKKGTILVVASRNTTEINKVYTLIDFTRYKVQQDDAEAALKRESALKEQMKKIKPLIEKFHQEYDYQYNILNFNQARENKKDDILRYFTAEVLRDENYAYLCQQGTFLSKQIRMYIFRYSKPTEQ